MTLPGGYTVDRLGLCRILQLYRNARVEEVKLCTFYSTIVAKHPLEIENLTELNVCAV